MKRNQVKLKKDAENTFEKVAQEWWNAQKTTWSDNYATKTWRRIEANLLPWIGKIPINEIEPPLLLGQIRRMEKRGAYDAAHRVPQLAGSVFRFGIASGTVDRDPAADIRDALIKVPVKNLPAFTAQDDIKRLLRGIDNYEFSIIVYSALQVSALTFVRPGELRQATWDKFNIDDALWKIPAHRMKGRKDHLVPLARQTINFMQDLRPLTENCKGGFVFPGMRMNGKPMSENTVNMALRTMGISKGQMCAHGFRTMASTRLHESGLWDSRVIEIQLAHVDKNTIRGIYNRAHYLDERRKMMQWWADYLDSLREGAKIIPLEKT
ncbi:MAG: tyrosine-type recombinase/integrase [Desulfonatronovibrio sp.]